MLFHQLKPNLPLQNWFFFFLGILDFIKVNIFSTTCLDDIFLRIVFQFLFWNEISIKHLQAEVSLVHFIIFFITVNSFPYLTSLCTLSIDCFLIVWSNEVLRGHLVLLDVSLVILSTPSEDIVSRHLEKRFFIQCCSVSSLLQK